MGAQTSKTLDREALNNEEFFRETGDMYRASMRSATVSAIYMPLASLVISLATGAILIAGGHDVQHGVLTIGTLNFFINIGGMMFEPIRNFAGIFSEFQSCQAAAERVADVLTSVSEIVDSPEVTEKYGDFFRPRRENWEKIRGDVDFDHVSFWYQEGEPVLTDFDLHVKAGENIALVGETGGGKSTIVNLLCRFYEPREGIIRIDGRDYRERSQLWLQSSLGYVLQTPHLFSGSIMENIRYGRLEATDEEVREAARLVGADEFIEKLEKGYDTDAGEGGGNLSTGQKQLISFARAILADPAIFVLDEATSSIDTVSEQRIQAAADKLLRGRTSFVIAHRLSTVRSADRILVIDGGRILEAGSHRELMAKKGRYHELYENQFRRDRLQESLAALDEG
jgi:ATP-binding cassette subfamily B protein